MDLTGTWRAAPADEAVRRVFHEPEFDDSAWETLAIPGHWANHPKHSAVEAMLHRTRFETPEIAANPRRRWWLALDGVAQQGDVWLDGVYLGDTEGYFVPHQFEITELLAERAQHVLALDVSCRRFGDPDNRTTLTGALQDPELCGSASIVPGGIWRAVSLRATGPTAISHFRAVCLDANPARARLALRVVFDAPEAGSVVLRTRISGTDHELVHPAATGENRVEWTVEVPAPELWWPHSLGPSPLNDLRLDVISDGEVHDSRRVRIGLRSVRMRSWALVVNGERMFAKGISVLPTRPLPGQASAAEVRADVQAARDAGLDLIRPIAHVARPELYDAADELGMLIWQDLPLRGVMSRGIGKQARRQAREAVDLLGHHPSVAVWCAHDEPFPRPGTPRPTPPVLSQQRPSWNRAVLDRSLHRVLSRTDGSRPIVDHTAVPPHLPALEGTTSHLWFGWHGGRAADIASALARIPRMGRFVSAFGAASVNPGSLPDWPDVDWERLGQELSADPRALRRMAPPEGVRSAETWADRTRAAQAEVVKTTIELLRRLKYGPTGGFILHTLADPGPRGGFGVLDHGRRPKPGWSALLEACRPVIVVADPLPTEIGVDQTLHLAVHVVSDLTEEIPRAEVAAVVSLPGGRSIEQSWGGEVPADSCSLVGHLTFDTGPRTGPVSLSLTLRAGELEASNEFSGAIV